MQAAPNKSERHERVMHRAIDMAISSGFMRNVDLIWMCQRADKHDECFGDGQGCTQMNCKWRSQCMALTLFNSPEKDAARLIA